MGNKNIVDNTTSRGEFNRAYKGYLEGKGKISCTYCRYHRNENGKGLGCYGGYEKSNGTMHIKYPNWKLVSKNRKQWMPKSMKVEHKESGYGKWKRKYITLKWE